MDVNKYIGSKIKEFRIKKNIGQEELAEFLHTTPQTISRYELGQRKTGNDILFDLAKYFNVSINDFFPNTSYESLNHNTVKIPVLGIIKAGIPIEAQEEILDYIDIPKNWIKGNKDFFGLKISGDSMFPKYQEGDIVIFEKDEDIYNYNNKDCAIIINQNDATFKQVLLNENGMVLRPYNTAYDIMVYDYNQVNNLPIRIVGVAKGKWTKL